MERFLYGRKKILEIVQENYEIESTQDVLSAIKTLFKDTLQEMVNAEFETLRDRNNEFDPKIIPKNKRDASGIEDRIISLYRRGLSTRESMSKYKFYMT